MDTERAAAVSTAHAADRPPLPGRHQHLPGSKVSPWGRLRRRLAFCAVVGLAATICVTAPEGLADSDRQVARATGRVTITGARMPAIRPIEPGFIGLSLEYPTLLRYTGSDPAHLDPILPQLLRALSPGGSPSLRIGGVSTDHTWWPMRRIRRPPGVTYTLTPAWLAATGAFIRQLGARAIVGVNLEAGRPALAIAEARALLGGIGRARIAGVEIGNEPSNYPWFAWYRIRRRAVYARPHSYRFAQFTQDFSATARRLRGVPLAGPALAGYGWLRHLSTFIHALRRAGDGDFSSLPAQSVLSLARVTGAGNPAKPADTVCVRRVHRRGSAVRRPRARAPCTLSS